MIDDEEENRLILLVDLVDQAVAAYPELVQPPLIEDQRRPEIRPLRDLPNCLKDSLPNRTVKLLQTPQKPPRREDAVANPGPTPFSAC